MDEVHDVDVVGAQLVEEAEALDIFAAVVGHGLCEALAHKHVRTQAGGERIIAALIFCWLLGPEVVAEHRVQVDATLQRLNAPSVAYENRPRNVVLLHRHRDLGVVTVIFWHKPEEQLRLPLSATAIIPANAHRHQAHVTAKLHDVLRRYERVPLLTVAVNAPVVSAYRVCGVYQRCVYVCLVLLQETGCFSRGRIEQGRHDEQQLGERGFKSR